ncbi:MULTISPECIES: hypothetical protein [unclassified Rhizobium]|nr:MULTISPECIES: hypothetical protein [unclassified Rhizobium]
MIVAVIAFATGCALGPLAFVVAPTVALVVPAVAAAAGLSFTPPVSEG